MSIKRGNDFRHPYWKKEIDLRGIGRLYNFTSRKLKSGLKIYIGKRVGLIEKLEKLKTTQAAKSFKGPMALKKVEINKPKVWKFISYQIISSLTLMGEGIERHRGSRGSL